MTKTMAEWRTRTCSNKPSNVNAKLYTMSEHLTMDKITVIFNRRIIFKQHIPNKHNLFGQKRSNDLHLSPTAMTTCKIALVLLCMLSLKK